MNEFVCINLKCAGYSNEAVFRIEITEFTDWQLTKELIFLLNPESDIDYFHWLDFFNISPEELDDELIFPDIYAEICNLLKNKIVFYHSAHNLLALHCLCEKYELVVPEADYINSATMVRRVWDEYSMEGFGLSDLRKDFNIGELATDALATAQLVVLAHEKQQCDIQVLVDITINPKISKGQISYLEKGEGNPDGPLFGETIVFSGSQRNTKEELREIVLELGCNFSDTLNHGTTILVVGIQRDDVALARGGSGKMLKAEKWNKEGKAKIQILTSDDFYKMLAIYNIKC